MQWQTFVFISVHIIYLLTACSLAAVLWTDELVYISILNNTNINQHNLPTTALQPHGSRVGEEVVAVCGNTRLHQFHLSYGYHQSSVSQSAAACVVPCSRVHPGHQLLATRRLTRAYIIYYSSYSMFFFFQRGF